MKKIPRVHVQGWHGDGPVYQIEQQLTGRRNRHLRRAVERGEAEAVEQVGHPGGRNSGKPAAFQVFSSPSAELWLLNKGHVYELTVFIDDELHELHVDAREDYGQFALGADMELHDWRELDADEIAELENRDDEDTELDESGVEDLTDEELEALTAPEESGDDEDAVGGDSGKSESDEEE